jgi:hypothetical protein
MADDIFGTAISDLLEYHRDHSVMMIAYFQTMMTATTLREEKAAFGWDVC